jgi:hypothetical protein
MNAFMSSLDNLYDVIQEETGADAQVFQEFKTHFSGLFFPPQDIELSNPLHPVNAYGIPGDRQGNRNRLWVAITNALPEHEAIVEYMFDRPDSDCYTYTTRLLRSWSFYSAQYYHSE